ncbi:mRNA cap guanine-N7 methyltransferase [Malassezia pachydermatis]
MAYDPLKDPDTFKSFDAEHASEASSSSKPRPYAPTWRVSEPKSVAVPITSDEIEQFKRRSRNPLRDDTQEFQLPVRRKRQDSETGDSSMVAMHYNQRREVGRDAREYSPIIPLKRFNNWIKSALIAMYAHSSGTRGKGGRVLDLGCGKGGDLRKWDRQRPAHMVMIDLATISVEQAQDRYKEGNYRWPADFFTFDCFRPKFDTVTMQFCLHYGWDTEESARTMLSNVSKWLRPGGTFIGTIPDEETLFARLDAQPEVTDLSFGNENYRIEFEERHESGEKPFGNKYRFWLEDAVDDVPEYVVDWATFER